MEWSPIQPTQVEVIGVNPQADGVLDVAVHLSDTPPPAWAQWFSSCPDVAVPVNLRASWEVHGDRITIAVEDSSMESWVGKIKECIARANALYESETLPGLKAREEAEFQRKAEEDRRLEKARRRAENL